MRQCLTRTYVNALILEVNWRQIGWKYDGRKSVIMKKEAKKEIESCSKILKEWNNMLLC